jgi:hypothetical protein
MQRSVCLNDFELQELIDEPQRAIIDKIIDDSFGLFQTAPGSSHNHQAWPGGYWDHVMETMNFAVDLYGLMSQMRTLCFTLSEALVVMFLHDIEKPWKYRLDSDGELVDNPDIPDKAARKAFRDAKLAEYGLVLNPRQLNAMLYVEGELGDYTNSQRAMWPLAAFCHMCDIASARVWPNSPAPKGVVNDSWLRAVRINKAAAYPEDVEPRECPHCATLTLGDYDVEPEELCEYCGNPLA